MLGGATKKAFTYGKRGRTTDQISTDDSTSGDDVHLRTTLVLPSQTKKASSSQTRPAATNHGRSAMTSPRSKGATSRAQLKKHQTEPQHHLASEPSKRALVPTQASLSHISSPRRVKVSRDRAKLRAAELLQPSPRRVQVDIETLDESGRRVRNERRMTRPEFETVPSHPTRPNALPSTSRVHVAGKAKQPMSFTRDMDDMPPTRASQIIDLTTPAMQRTSRSSAGLRPQVDSQSVRSVRHKTVTRAIIISSDDSDTGESHPQVFNGHKPRQHPIVISSDEQDGNTPVSRASKRAPSNPPSAPEPVPPSIAQDIASHPVSPPFAWAPVNHLHRGSQRASTPRRVSIGRQPRRLTPIVSRNGRKSGFPKRSTPITPDILTDSELDLTQDFANLDLSSASAGVEGTELSPEWLHGLLEECQQRGPHEFSAFVETFPFDPVVRSSDGTVSTPLQKFRKIGEASYSEVFGIGDVVLKVIPLRDIAEAATINDIPESPPPSDASDVLREIVVTREIASTCGDGFTRLLKTYVVRGKYPSRLLSLWDEYDAQKGSESIRPGE
jgi:serine/threonine-protein kinase haspin